MHRSFRYDDIRADVCAWILATRFLARKEHKLKLYLFLAIAVFAWGAVTVLEKTIIDKVHPWGFIFWRWVGLGICLGILLLVSPKFRAVIFAPEAKTIVIACITGVMSWFIAQYFFFRALELEQVSLVVPFTATFPFVTSILAYFFLREPITMAKFLGTALIVAGCVLLSRGTAPGS
jgi:transporter family protein